MGSLHELPRPTGGCLQQGFPGMFEHCAGWRSLEVCPAVSARSGSMSDGALMDAGCGAAGRDNDETQSTIRIRREARFSSVFRLSSAKKF